MANEPRQSKADRREEARLKALQLRAEQKKRERRNRIIGLGGLGVAVVALAVVVGILASVIPPGDKPPA